MLEEPRILGGIGDGWKEISIMCSKSQYGKMLGVVKKYCQKYGWEYQSNKIDDDVFEIIVSEWDESTLTDDYRESTKKFSRKFKESFNIDDYADMSEEDKPKFDIGEHVVLTDEFFYGSDSTMQKFPRTGWMIEDVRECKYDTDGHGKFEYYVVHDNPFRKKIMDDDIDYSGGWWVLEYEIDKEKPRERMWRESDNKKFGRKFKESYSGRQVKLTADFEVVGDTVEEALEDLHSKLLNADAAITDGNGNPNGEIVEKYEYWDEENEGDTFFNLCKDSNAKGYMIVELENV